MNPRFFRKVRRKSEAPRRRDDYHQKKHRPPVDLLQADSDAADANRLHHMDRQQSFFHRELNHASAAAFNRWNPHERSGEKRKAFPGCRYGGSPSRMRQLFRRSGPLPEHHTCLCASPGVQNTANALPRVDHTRKRITRQTGLKACS